MNQEQANNAVGVAWAGARVTAKVGYDTEQGCFAVYMIVEDGLVACYSLPDVGRAMAREIAARVCVGRAQTG